MRYARKSGSRLPGLNLLPAIVTELVDSTCKIACQHISYLYIMTSLCHYVKQKYSTPLGFFRGLTCFLLHNDVTMSVSDAISAPSFLEAHRTKSRQALSTLLLA